MVNREMAQCILDRLNEICKPDANVLHSLIGNRVCCSNALGASDNPVQVSKIGDALFVGMLGILNGICGMYDESDCPREEIMGWGPIAAVYSDEGELLRFQFTK